MKLKEVPVTPIIVGLWIGWFTGEQSGLWFHVSVTLILTLSAITKRTSWV